MLDARDISRVKESFEYLLPLQEDAAEAFYDSLFEQYPEVRGLFPTEMQEQTGKLWSLMVTAVEGLDKFDQLIPTLRDLGQRHVTYGVVPDHYPIVANVLIETTAFAMGPEFTPAHKGSWEKVLGMIADEMLAGAARAARR